MTRGLLAAWTATGFQSYAISRLEPGGRGALRSFSALFIALPLYVLSGWLEGHNPRLPSTAGWFVFDGLFYGLSWVFFAGLAYFLARMLDLGENLPRFISAYNWSRVMVLLMLMPLYAVSGFSLTSTFTENLIFLMSWAFVIAYKSFIARHALGSSWAQGVLIVLLDLIFFRIMQQMGVTVSSAIL